MKNSEINPQIDQETENLNQNTISEAELDIITRYFSAYEATDMSRAKSYALSRAIDKKDLRATQIMIEKLKIDVNKSSLNSKIPLELALDSGSADIVSYLAKKGADVEALTTNNKTLLAYALSLFDRSAFKDDIHDCILALLDAGAEIKTIFADKELPHIMDTNEGIEVFKLFLFFSSNDTSNSLRSIIDEWFEGNVKYGELKADLDEYHQIVPRSVIRLFKETNILTLNSKISEVFKNIFSNDDLIMIQNVNKTIAHNLSIISELYNHKELRILNHNLVDLKKSFGDKFDIDLIKTNISSKLGYDPFEKLSLLKLAAKTTYNYIEDYDDYTQDYITEGKNSRMILSHLKQAFDYLQTAKSFVVAPTWLKEAFKTHGLVNTNFDTNPENNTETSLLKATVEILADSSMFDQVE